MYYIGVDVGGMSIKGGLVTESGDIVARHTVETQRYSEEYGIAEDIRKVVDGVLAEGKVDISDILGIGIGQPGSVDSERGIIRYSNNIPLERVPVVAQLKKFYDVPVYINNDANCAALGEYVFGAGKGYRDIVFVTLGTGVGSGIIIGGKLFEGRECAGAEAGHMVIVCGGGTYIRALARDIAAALGTVAFMSALTRTRSGMFTLEDAVTMDDFRAAPEEHIIPAGRALEGLPRLVLDHKEERMIANGVPVPSAYAAGESAAVFSADGGLLGLGQADERGMRLRVRL